jgi:hypothetical protein
MDASAHAAANARMNQRLTSALCRVHESLSPNARQQATPATAAGLAAHVWSIGELLDAALAVAPREPTETAPDRRRRFQVIEGGKG